MSAESFNHVVMSTYGRYDLTISHGEGAKLWDVNGKEYLDFVAGIATCTLGHANPVFVQAVCEQAKKMAHVSNLYYTNEQEALAAFLVANSCADKAFFCNSGAEANEGAIKLARLHAHEKRGISNPQIITAEKSFHGRTLAALTATAQEKYHKGFAPLVPGFHYTPFNDVEALKKKVAEVGKDLAAIMLEPLQGEGGIMPAEQAYLEEARRLCDETGALLIFDEVQVGVGRSGSFWAHQVYGVEPDIFTSAKGLGGGFPIGALLAKESAAVFKPGTHASTFGGNPLASHVALAVCKEVAKPGFLENVKIRGEQLRAGLMELVNSKPEIYQTVRGLGLINGLVIKESAGVLAADIVSKAMSAGLLLVPAGTHVIRFVPALNISQEDVSKCLEILSKVG